MGLSIKYKLFFAILSAHVIVYAAMYSIGRYNFDRGFLEYISRIEESQVPALVAGLTDFYNEMGSWDALRDDPNKWVDLVRESIEVTYDPSRDQATQPARPTPGSFSPNDWYYASEYSPARPYILLLEADQSVIFGNPAALPLANLNPIVAKGDTVGFLAVTSRQQLSAQADILFSEQQRETFFQFALALGAISALIAFPLASFLVRPVREVVQGTRSLIKGDYGSRIPTRGSDELTQLAEDFNILAKTLDQNRSARQQWISDISHELRTPLSVLQAGLESMQDGVRPMDPDTMDSLHREVVHLNALVNDLHELSMSDSGALTYTKAPMDLCEVLELCLDTHRQLVQKHQIRITVNIKHPDRGKEIRLLADQDRILQLFENLLQNTCRYTDDGGCLDISIRVKKSAVLIEWSDSAPGVSDEDLPRLFERLYRVDSSRGRNKGGSGLGLAICKNIVSAHEGSIQAGHSSLGGLKFTIWLPIRSG